MGKLVFRLISFIALTLLGTSCSKNYCFSASYAKAKLFFKNASEIIKRSYKTVTEFVSLPQK